jgi:hypothetical protein
LKPLNIWSRSDEEIGQLMSNFSHTPFVLDGVEFASIEAFYVWLLLPEGSKKDKVCSRWAMWAKREFPTLKPEQIVYRGESMLLGGDAHLHLIKRALRAKLEAHPTIARAFVATRPRPLIHETGHPDKPDAEFPRRTFCRLLSELREEFALHYPNMAGAVVRNPGGDPCVLPDPPIT